MDLAGCIRDNREKASPMTLTENSKHEYFMKEALQMVPASFPLILYIPIYANLKQGENALATGETPVGCVLVHDGKIIGSGMNDTNKSMNVRPPRVFLCSLLSCCQSRVQLF
jgi:hypothetical protein